MSKLLRQVSPIYHRSKIMKAILECQECELEIAEGIVFDIQNQMFVRTATWGLALWEQELGLRSNATDGLPTRRARIISKIRSRAPVNRVKVESILAGLSGRRVSVFENIRNYSIEVAISSGKNELNLIELEGRLNSIKPAHLSHDLLIRITASCEVKSKASRHAFGYRKTNKLVAGTHPRMTLKGSSRNSLLTINSKLRSYRMDYIKSGTLPYPSNIATLLRQDLSSSLNLSAAIIDYALCGVSPYLSTIGAIESSCIEPGSSVFTQTFMYETTSDTHLTGLSPFNSSVGNRLDSESETDSKVEVLTFSYTVCGTKKCGD